jgi:hypothetical protein
MNSVLINRSLRDNEPVLRVTDERDVQAADKGSTSIARLTPSIAPWSSADSRADSGARLPPDPAAPTSFGPIERAVASPGWNSAVATTPSSAAQTPRSLSRSALRVRVTRAACWVDLNGPSIGHRLTLCVSVRSSSQGTHSPPGCTVQRLRSEFAAAARSLGGGTMRQGISH